MQFLTLMTFKLDSFLVFEYGNKTTSESAANKVNRAVG